MKESIAIRVGRIISGGANRLVDMLENAAPDIVLEQAIREIDDALFDVRSELGKIAASKYLAGSRLLELNKTHEDLSSKIEFALSQTREDLAEAAVSKQLDIEAQIPVLETSMTDLGAQEKELEKFITALLAKKRELSHELTEFKKSRETENSAKQTGAISTSSSMINAEVKVQKAESVFERILDRKSLPTSMKTESQLAELEDLSRKNRISERLAQIKAKASS